MVWLPGPEACAPVAAEKNFRSEGRSNAAHGEFEQCVDSGPEHSSFRGRTQPHSANCNVINVRIQTLRAGNVYVSS